MLIFGGGEEISLLQAVLDFPMSAPFSYLAVVRRGIQSQVLLEVVSAQQEMQGSCETPPCITSSSSTSHRTSEPPGPTRASTVMRFWEVSTSPRQEGSEELKVLLRFEIKATQVTKSLLLQHASSAQAALLFCTEQPRHKNFSSMMFNAWL